MLINIIGDWSGSVFGLPAGMSWMQTPTGIALMSSGSGGGSGTGGGLGSLFASNTNTATVNNNVEVYALTGNNQATSATTSDASVSTGNAYASANVVNIVNTNVIGQNWVFAIFNIFGSWLGNLNFGKPDLWIGGVAQTPNPTDPGSIVTYKFTVSNTGDADATNVKLSADFVKDLLDFTDGEDTAGGVMWNLGAILHGETKEFTFAAKAGDVPVGVQVPAPLQAKAVSRVPIMMVRSSVLSVVFSSD
jgi:hypothetical protein